MRTKLSLGLLMAAVLCWATGNAWAATVNVEWNFNGDLNATYGSGTMSGHNITEGSDYSFGTTASYGIAALPNDNGKQVMRIINAFSPTQWLNIVAGAANNGGAKINQYTMIWDVMYVGPANSYAAFFQANPANSDDNELSRGPTGGIGLDGFPGNMPIGEWHRVALTINATDDQDTFIRKYLDGNILYPGGDPDPALDGRYGLDPTNGFLLFADNNGETGNWYVSSFYFSDSAMNNDDVKALGGVDALGIIPEPATMGLLMAGGLGLVIRQKR